MHRRFFSTCYNVELSRVCQMPRIKAAMQQEQVSKEQLAATANVQALACFETNNKLYDLYQQGFLSFKQFAFAPGDEQQKMVLFLQQCAVADELVKKNRLDLRRHLPYLRWPIFDLFNPKFCKHLLDNNMISFEAYLTANRLDAFYALSQFFLKADFEPWLIDGSLTLDKLLLLSHQEIADLTRLLSPQHWQASAWICAKHLILEQFVQAHTDDRNAYMDLMFHEKKPRGTLTFHSFLLLKTSTRRTFQFNQAYITLEVFDALEVNLQVSIQRVVCSNMGRYALDKGYITLEQYGLLSPEARAILAELLQETEEMSVVIDNKKSAIDRIFFKGFDFTFFDEQSQQSVRTARNYLGNESHLFERGPR